MNNRYFFMIIFLLGSLITVCNNKLLCQNTNGIDSLVHGFKNKLYDAGQDFIYYAYGVSYEYLILKDKSKEHIHIYRVIYKDVYATYRTFNVPAKNQIYWYIYHKGIDNVFAYFIDHFDEIQSAEIDAPKVDTNRRFTLSHVPYRSFRLEVNINGKKIFKKGNYLDLLWDNPILKSLIFIEREMLFFEFDKKGWTLSIDYSKPDKRKKRVRKCSKRVGRIK